MFMTKERFVEYLKAKQKQEGVEQLTPLTEGVGNPSEQNKDKLGESGFNPDGFGPATNTDAFTVNHNSDVLVGGKSALRTNTGTDLFEHSDGSKGLVTLDPIDPQNPSQNSLKRISRTFGINVEPQLKELLGAHLTGELSAQDTIGQIHNVFKTAAQSSVGKNFKWNPNNPHIGAIIGQLDAIKKGGKPYNLTEGGNPTAPRDLVDSLSKILPVLANPDSSETGNLISGNVPTKIRSKISKLASQSQSLYDSIITKHGVTEPMFGDYKQALQDIVNNGKTIHSLLSKGTVYDTSHVHAVGDEKGLHSLYVMNPTTGTAHKISIDPAEQLMLHEGQYRSIDGNPFENPYGAAMIGNLSNSPTLDPKQIKHGTYQAIKNLKNVKFLQTVQSIIREHGDSQVADQVSNMMKANINNPEKASGKHAKTLSDILKLAGKTHARDEWFVRMSHAIGLVAPELLPPSGQFSTNDIRRARKIIDSTQEAMEDLLTEEGVPDDKLDLLNKEAEKDPIIGSLLTQGYDMRAIAAHLKYTELHSTVLGSLRDLEAQRQSLESNPDSEESSVKLPEVKNKIENLRNKLKWMATDEFHSLLPTSKRDNFLDKYQTGLEQSLLDHKQTGSSAYGRMFGSLNEDDAKTFDSLIGHNERQQLIGELLGKPDQFNIEGEQFVGHPHEIGQKIYGLVAARVKDLGSTAEEIQSKTDELYDQLDRAKTNSQRKLITEEINDAESDFKVIQPVIKDFTEAFNKVLKYHGDNVYKHIRRYLSEGSTYKPEWDSDGLSFKDITENLGSLSHFIGQAMTDKHPAQGYAASPDRAGQLTEQAKEMQAQGSSDAPVMAQRAQKAIETTHAMQKYRASALAFGQHEKHVSGIIDTLGEGLANLDKMNPKIHRSMRDFFEALGYHVNASERNESSILSPNEGEILGKAFYGNRAIAQMADLFSHRHGIIEEIRARHFANEIKRAQSHLSLEERGVFTNALLKLLKRGGFSEFISEDDPTIQKNSRSYGEGSIIAQVPGGNREPLILNAPTNESRHPDLQFPEHGTTNEIFEYRNKNNHLIADELHKQIMSAIPAMKTFNHDYPNLMAELQAGGTGVGKSAATHIINSFGPILKGLLYAGATPKQYEETMKMLGEKVSRDPMQAFHHLVGKHGFHDLFHDRIDSIIYKHKLQDSKVPMASFYGQERQARNIEDVLGKLGHMSQTEPIPHKYANMPDMINGIMGPDALKASTGLVDGAIGGLTERLSGLAQTGKVDLENYRSQAFDVLERLINGLLPELQDQGFAKTFQEKFGHDRLFREGIQNEFLHHSLEGVRTRLQQNLEHAQDQYQHASGDFMGDYESLLQDVSDHAQASGVDSLMATLEKYESHQNKPLKPADQLNLANALMKAVGNFDTSYHLKNLERLTGKQSLNNDPTRGTMRSRLTKIIEQIGNRMSLQGQHFTTWKNFHKEAQELQGLYSGVDESGNPIFKDETGAEALKVIQSLRRKLIGYTGGITGETRGARELAKFGSHMAHHYPKFIAGTLRQMEDLDKGSSQQEIEKINQGLDSEVDKLQKKAARKMKKEGIQQEDPRYISRLQEVEEEVRSKAAEQIQGLEEGALQKQQEVAKNLVKPTLGNMKNGVSGERVLGPLLHNDKILTPLHDVYTDLIGALKDIPMMHDTYLGQQEPYYSHKIDSMIDQLAAKLEQKQRRASSTTLEEQGFKDGSDRRLKLISKELGDDNQSDLSKSVRSILEMPHGSERDQMIKQLVTGEKEKLAAHRQGDKRVPRTADDIQMGKHLNALMAGLGYLYAHMFGPTLEHRINLVTPMDRRINPLARQVIEKDSATVGNLLGGSK